MNMEQSDEMQGLTPCESSGRQGGLSSCSSTSNISSSFRQTQNLSGHLITGKLFRNRSRIGVLARSALNNESADSVCNLSPNSVQGMKSLRSNLGLPPLEINCGSARLSKSPPTSGYGSLSKSPPEFTSPESSASSHEPSSLAESLDLLQTSDKSCGKDMSPTIGGHGQKTNSLSPSNGLGEGGKPRQLHTVDRLVPPSIKTAVYAQLGMEYEPTDLPQLDHNQNIPPREVTTTTFSHGQSRASIPVASDRVSLRRATSMTSIGFDPLLKRKPLTLSHNISSFTPMETFASKPSNPSKNIIIKTPNLKPMTSSFVPVAHNFTPFKSLPTSEANVGLCKTPVARYSLPTTPKPPPFLETETPSSSRIGTPLPSSTCDRDLCPPPPPPPVPSTLSRQKLTRPGAKKPPSMRMNSEFVQGKQYLLIKLIGKGGSGEVWMVMEQETCQLYALKIVCLAGYNESIVTECINEVKLLEELKGTKLVIQIISWERNYAEQTMNIVMELGQCDLTQVFIPGEDICVFKVKYMWERMLEILVCIHKRGIVHADLKPANFVLVNGNLKIIDFGIANRLQIDHTSIATLNPRGTLNFISPETITPDVYGRTKTSPKSDIWSLGCILHLMVFGVTPFQGISNSQAKMNAIMNGVTQYPELPPAFSKTSVLSVLKLCFEKDPKLRPTAAELLDHPFLACSS